MAFAEQNLFNETSQLGASVVSGIGSALGAGSVSSVLSGVTSGLLRGMLAGGPLVAGVEVSVMLSEAHSFTATPSSFSLESGSQVCDHVIVNPDEVSIVFSMSNVGSGRENARDVFETFKRMLAQRQLVELITEHYVYENMILTSISPMHQAPYKGALNFSIKLQQVNFVQLELLGRNAESLNPDSPTSRTAAGPSNAGQVEAKPVNLEKP